MAMRPITAEERTAYQGTIDAFDQRISEHAGNTAPEVLESIQGMRAVIARYTQFLHDGEVDDPDYYEPFPRPEPRTATDPGTTIPTTDPALDPSLAPELDPLEQAMAALQQTIAGAPEGGGDLGGGNMVVTPQGVSEEAHKSSLYAVNRNTEIFAGLIRDMFVGFRAGAGSVPQASAAPSSGPSTGISPDMEALAKKLQELLGKSGKGHFFSLLGNLDRNVLERKLDQLRQSSLDLTKAPDTKEAVVELALQTNEANAVLIQIIETALALK